MHSPSSSLPCFLPHPSHIIQHIPTQLTSPHSSSVRVCGVVDPPTNTHQHPPNVPPLHMPQVLVLDVAQVDPHCLTHPHLKGGQALDDGMVPAAVTSQHVTAWWLRPQPWACLPSRYGSAWQWGVRAPKRKEQMGTDTIITLSGWWTHRGGLGERSLSCLSCTQHSHHVHMPQTPTIQRNQQPGTHLAAILALNIQQSHCCATHAPHLTTPPTCASQC